jgi:hypothetical protein
MADISMRSIEPLAFFTGNFCRMLDIVFEYVIFFSPPAALESTPVKYVSLCFLRNNLTGQAEITERFFFFCPIGSYRLDKNSQSLRDNYPG